MFLKNIIEGKHLQQQNSSFKNIIEGKHLQQQKRSLFFKDCRKQFTLIKELFMKAKQIFKKLVICKISS